MGPCVIALGTFDGVHLGHQALIKTAMEAARKMNALSAVFTFDGHPLQVLQPDAAPEPLMTNARRQALLDEMGLDVLVERPFTHEFAAQSPEMFVQKLVEAMHPVALVVGYNYTFGRRGAGNVDLLRQMGPQYGFQVIEISPVKADGQPVSSTRIRQLLREGKMSEVKRLIGREIL